MYPAIYLHKLINIIIIRQTTILLLIRSNQYTIHIYKYNIIMYLKYT